jgi:4-hydroxy-tetrahydrodipicolinate synthase
MLTGLSAFPLTPSTDDGIDEAAYARLIRRLVDAGVDSIGALSPIDCLADVLGG